MQFTDLNQPPHRNVMFEVADDGSVFFNVLDVGRGGNYYAMIAVANKLHVTHQNREGLNRLKLARVQISEDGADIKAFRVYWHSEGGQGNERDHEEVPIPPKLLAQFTKEWGKRHPKKAVAT